jgi:hypothetical protein
MSSSLPVRWRRHDSRVASGEGAVNGWEDRRRLRYSLRANKFAAAAAAALADDEAAAAVADGMGITVVVVYSSSRSLISQ